MPATRGSQIKGPCARIDLLKQHAGIDLQAMYPAGAPPKADAWTWDTFLNAAETCHKAGVPFGIGMGKTADSIDSVGAIFDALRRTPGRREGQDHGQVGRHAPGARLLQAAGPFPAARRVVVGRRLQQQVADLRQGRADHEPAQRLGGGQARRAEDRRAAAGRSRHAEGAEGALPAVLPYFWGIWTFSKNKAAAKSLLQPPVAAPAVEQLVAASGGYDVPAFARLTTLKIWAEVGPPKGTLYHYPDPRQPPDRVDRRQRRRRAEIAEQIYVQAIMTKMVVRHMQGEAMEKTLAWAESELEGFMR